MRWPGTVLRVSSRRIRSPANASTQARVSVAIPHRRCRKFSAVRSAVRMARTGPSTSPKTRPGSTTRPSSTKKWTWHRGSNRRKVRRAASSPATTSRSLHRKLALATWSAGTSASVVRSPGPTSSASARSMRRSSRSISALPFAEHGEVFADLGQPRPHLLAQGAVLGDHVRRRTREEALVGESALDLFQLGGELLLLLPQLGHQLFAVDHALEGDAEVDAPHEAGRDLLGPALGARRRPLHLGEAAQPADPRREPR